MDKRKLILITIAALSVPAIILFYSLFAFSGKDSNLGIVISLAVLLIVVVFMVFFIIKRYKSIRDNLPAEDERSRKVLVNAAAKSFYVSLYWLLAIGWFEDSLADLFGINQLTASQAAGLAIAGMALLFFSFWLYYDKKGKLL